MKNETLYLTRQQASEYLTDGLGIPVATKTLAKLSVVGGGPRYRKFGNRVLYQTEDLVTWANNKLSAIVENSSDKGVRNANTL